MYQVNAEITHYENLFIKTTNILDADCRRELEWYYKKTYDNTKKNQNFNFDLPCLGKCL